MYNGCYYPERSHRTVKSSPDFPEGRQILKSSAKIVDSTDIIVIPEINPNFIIDIAVITENPFLATKAPRHEVTTKIILLIINALCFFVSLSLRGKKQNQAKMVWLISRAFTE
jgi:hypothetical protein